MSMFAGAHARTEDEIGHLATCIAHGLVFSSRCLPHPKLPLAYLAPPIGFTAADLDKYVLFGWYGVNEYDLTPTPWGTPMLRFVTCSVWPRHSFALALTTAEHIKAEQGDGVGISE